MWPPSDPLSEFPSLFFSPAPFRQEIIIILQTPGYYTRLKPHSTYVISSFVNTYSLHCAILNICLISGWKLSDTENRKWEEAAGKRFKSGFHELD